MRIVVDVRHSGEPPMPRDPDLHQVIVDVIVPAAMPDVERNIVRLTIKGAVWDLLDKWGD